MLAPPAARRLSFALSLIALACAACAASAAAQGDDPHADLARRVIAAAGGVKPGDIVMLDGGLHTVPLMEAVAVEVSRSGGVPAMYVRTDRLARASLLERPVVHARTADSADAVLYGHELQYATMFINFPASEDPQAAWREAAADTARMKALTAAWSATQGKIDSMRNHSRARFVQVNYPPLRATVARSGMDSASFARMQWAAVTADQARLEQSGRAIARLLERGRTIRVTTPAGTDLRLALAGRPAALNAGLMPADHGRARLAALRTVSLPGGDVTVAPLETAATGRVVLPRSDCPDAPLVNARFDFRGGKLSGFSADSGGACVTRYLAANTSPADVFGYVTIGLNPALRPVDAGAGYYPWSASGMVHIGVGNNADFGGTNGAAAGLAFALMRATVEIDGTVVVRDGQLTGPAAAGH